MKTKRRRTGPRIIQVTLPKVGLVKKPASRGAGARVGSNTVALVKWGGRWTWRGTSWAAPKVGRSVYRVAQHTAYPPVQRVVAMRDNIREHGFGHTFVTDHDLPAVDGNGTQLSQVRTMVDVSEVHGPEAGDTAALVRQARHEHVLLTHQLRRDSGPLVTRALDRSAERLRQYEFEHMKALVAAKKAAATTDPNAAPPTPGPTLVPVPTQSKEPVTVANSINDFADLGDPGIDPMEFQEELPEWLAGVAVLFQKAADGAGEMAEHFSSVPGLEGSIVVALNAAAEAVGDAVTQVQQAHQAAEAAYSDFAMPRFDKVG
ncbi:MAG: hypothetical protein JWO67_3170 [Streptosporangiaceae bacterium]|nr:hypothetical protein [Streptosporangiaceae bacterium]